MLLSHPHRQILQAVSRRCFVSSSMRFCSLFADRYANQSRLADDSNFSSSLMPKHTIVRDSATLANAIVKYIPDSDVENYKVMLQTLRENPDIRPLVLAKLTEQLQSHHNKHALVNHNSPNSNHDHHVPKSEDVNGVSEGVDHNLLPSVPSNKSSQHRNTTKWLDTWLKKVLNSSRSNLFPLRIPHASEKKMLERKARLAAYLFANKQILHSSFREFLLTEDPMKEFVTPNKDERVIYTHASKIADDLGNHLYTDKLSQITRVVRHYVEGQVDQEGFLLELSSICSLHIDQCEEMLTFLGIPMNRPFQMLIQSRRLRRQRLVEELQAELSYVVFTHSNMQSRPPSQVTDLSTSATSMEEVDGGLDISMPYDKVTNEPEQRALEQAMNTRRPKISFNTSHVFEVTIRCFSKANSATNKFSIDANSNLYFESAIKNMRSDSSTSDKEYDLIANSIREEYFEDSHHQHALHKADDEQSQHDDEGEEDELSIENYASSHRKIMIDNLPDVIDEQGLRDALRNCGKIKKIWLFRASDQTATQINTLMSSDPVFQGNSSAPQTNQIVDLPDVSLLESLSVQQRKAKGVAVADEIPLSDSDDNREVVLLDEEEEEDETQESQILAKQVEEIKRKNRSYSYKRKIKSKVLKGNRTDNYAFVQMEDDHGFAKVTCDAIRIFGINIHGQSCRTYKVDGYRNFRLEVKDQLSIKEVHQAIGLALAEKHECYVVNKINDVTK